MEQDRGPDADGRAGHGGDERLGERGRGLQEPKDRAVGARRRVHHEVGQVVAAGEHAAAPAQHDHADGAVGRGLLQRVGQAGVHGARERVLLLGPVEFEVEDAAVERRRRRGPGASRSSGWGSVRQATGTPPRPGRRWGRAPSGLWPGGERAAGHVSCGPPAPAPMSVTLTAPSAASVDRLRAADAPLALRLSLVVGTALLTGLLAQFELRDLPVGGPAHAAVAGRLRGRPVSGLADRRARDAGLPRARPRPADVRGRRHRPRPPAGRLGRLPRRVPAGGARRGSGAPSGAAGWGGRCSRWSPARWSCSRAASSASTSSPATTGPTRPSTAGSGSSRGT